MELLYKLLFITYVVSFLVNLGILYYTLSSFNPENPNTWSELTSSCYADYNCKDVNELTSISKHDTLWSIVVCAIPILNIVFMVSLINILTKRD